MTKTQSFARALRRKRAEISRLQDDLADLQDHLLVLEARVKNAGRATYSAAQVRELLAPADIKRVA